MPLPSVSGSTVGRGAVILGSAIAVALFAGCGSSTGSSSSGSSSGGGTATKTITTASTGKAIFEGAGCVSCHTLADAGSKGNIGPNLDNSKPSVAKALDNITAGAGSMPSFKGRLTDAQIKTVAAYVHDVTQ